MVIGICIIKGFEMGMGFRFNVFGVQNIFINDQGFQVYVQYMAYFLDNLFLGLVNNSILVLFIIVRYIDYCELVFVAFGGIIWFVFVGNINVDCWIFIYFFGFQQGKFVFIIFVEENIMQFKFFKVMLNVLVKNQGGG